MGEIVPNDFKKRNDFVTRAELRDCCSFIGVRIGHDLKDLFTYYVVNV